MSIADGIKIKLDVDATEFDEAVKEAISALDELEEAVKKFACITNVSAENMFMLVRKYTAEKNVPLLTIELEDETAIPKVFYKGEEVTNRMQINFDWVTKGLINPGGMKFNLEYGDDKGIIHTVGRRRGDMM